MTCLHIGTQKSVTSRGGIPAPASHCATRTISTKETS